MSRMGFDIYFFDANNQSEFLCLIVMIHRVYLIFTISYVILVVLNVLNHHTHLLVSAPPLGSGDPILQHEELLKSRLMAGNLKWLCYLLSTSVYSNCGGMWVDEEVHLMHVNLFLTLQGNFGKKKKKKV
ncbi:hypothetical protein CsSME_00009421 [Camellia sinensis var. sinensis]